MCTCQCSFKGISFLENPHSKNSTWHVMSKGYFKDQTTFINTLNDHDIHMWQQACAVLLHTFTTSVSHHITFTDEIRVNLGTKSDMLTSGLNKFTFFEVVWGSWNLDMGDWKTDSSKEVLSPAYFCHHPMCFTSDRNWQEHFFLLFAQISLSQS
jgi:hypothetical protein